MKLANIHGVRNPPEGFLTWVTENLDAVTDPNTEKWEDMKKVYVDSIISQDQNFG